MKDGKGNTLITRTAWVQKQIILCPKCGADCDKLPIIYTEAKTLKCTSCEYLSWFKREKG
jgi:hypothetical protein